MKVVFCTHKGGTGKTTTAIHIARARSLQKKKVLFIDLDPQANSSYKLLPKYRDFNKAIDAKEGTVYASLVNKKPIPIYDSKYEGIYISPAHLVLSEAQNELQSQQGLTHERLKQAIEKVEADYDDVIIDNPPTLSIINTNGLIASDVMVIVVEPDDFSLIAVEQMNDNFKNLIAGEYKHHPRVAILMNMKEPTNLSNEVYKELTHTFSDVLLKTYIKRRTAIASAISNDSTLFDTEPKNPVLNDYLKLTSEIFNNGK